MLVSIVHKDHNFSIQLITNQNFKFYFYYYILVLFEIYNFLIYSISHSLLTFNNFIYLEKKLNHKLV